MKHLLSFALAVLITLTGVAQQKSFPKKQQYADLSFGFGNSQVSIVGGYYHNWNFGKKNRFFVGTGVRFGNYSGKNISFLSAPASLAAEESKTDTLFGPSPSIYSFNTFINLGYNLTAKLQAGFNIDVLGFSFGPEGSPVFRSNGGQVTTKAKPTSFNLLLVGNNDRGTLNSEFYLRYKFNDKLGLKGSYQYLFTELTTETKVQTIPEQNDRFRKKAGLFSVGISYYF